MAEEGSAAPAQKSRPVTSVTSFPLEVLRNAIDCEVVCELENGQSYAGRVHSIEDTMCVVLTDPTLSYKNGKSRQINGSVLIRGTEIAFFRLPEAVAQCAAVAAAMQLNNKKRHYKHKNRAHGKAEGEGSKKGFESFGKRRNTKRMREEVAAEPTNN